MVKSRAVAFVLFCCSLGPGRGGVTQQSVDQNAELSAKEEPALFKSSTSLVIVPVVLRDANGRTVGDVQREQFHIFDRGKLQVISKFVVEKAGRTLKPIPGAKGSGLELPPATVPVPESVLPDRFIAYLFDDVHVGINDLIMARDAVDRQIAAARSDVRAAIFTTSGQPMLDFTDNCAKLHDALFRLEPHPIAADLGQRDCPDLTYYWADRIRNQNDQEALNWALTEAAGCSHSPGAAAVLVRAAIARVIAGTEQSSMVSLDVLRGAVRRMSLMPGQRTLVLLSPGFLTTNGTGSAQSEIIDQAIRANVIVNAVDVRGLAAESRDVTKPIPELGGAQMGAYLAYREKIDHEVFEAQSDVLAELASGSGGAFFHNNNDLDAGLQRVTGVPEYMYILGFSPQNLKMDGTAHSLKVSLVPNPRHLDIDARRSYMAPKRLDDPEEVAKQEITQAIFSRDELLDIPVQLNTEYFKVADRARVTVVTHVDLRGLHLRQAEGRRSDTLTVTTALFDNNGNYVAGIQYGVRLNLKEANLDKWMHDGIKVQSKLEVKTGSYLVRVVVRDSDGQLMSARNASVDVR